MEEKEKDTYEEFYAAAYEEPEEQQPEAEEEFRRRPAEGEDAVEVVRSRIATFVMGVLSGSFLSRSEVRRVYPYMLLLAMLALLYITNVFRMQSLYRTQEKLTTEVKELRAKSMTLSAERAEAMRQSTIIRELDRRGIPLRESLAPNKVIER